MKKRILLLVLFTILLYSAGGVYYNIYFKDEKEKKVSNIDTISNFNYVLKSNVTKLYKDEFNNLKNNLTSESINNEEYAKSIAKLFIIDLYTLSNKNNKYDVGGADFIYPSAVDNYKLNVEDTIYKYMEDDSNGLRTQILPTVSSITVDSITDIDYKIGEEAVKAKKVKLSWTYEHDLDYDKSGEVILVKKDNKYYVVEKN